MLDVAVGAWKEVTKPDRDGDAQKQLSGKERPLRGNHLEDVIPEVIIFERKPIIHGAMKA